MTIATEAELQACPVRDLRLALGLDAEHREARNWVVVANRYGQLGTRRGSAVQANEVRLCGPFPSRAAAYNKIGVKQ